MENAFQKLCQLYLSEENDQVTEEIKNMIANNPPDVNEKAKSLTSKLKKKIEKLGFKTDFESFCNMLEHYINNKKEYNYDEKKEFLKLLISLSKIYEINLREELKRYSTSSTTEENIEQETELFYRFCRYNLEPNTDVTEFNTLKELADSLNINYKDLQKQSLLFTEDIKLHIERLNVNITENYFDSLLNEYMLIKANLSTEEKIEYLTILLYLSEIYELNLREIYTTKKNDQITQEKKENFSNILDNNNLLSSMIVNRYDNGYFDIKTLLLKDDKLPKKSSPYDKLKMTSDLIYRLYSIFVDKLNNYANDDLNSDFSSLIGEEELTRLSSLSREEIYEILQLIDKNEPVNYIVRKYKITSNLYKFINKTYKEVMNFDNEKFGLSPNNLFNTAEDYNDITIYFNGPEFESNFIVNEYIKRCVEYNVNYALSFEETDTSTLTYLYASKNDIKIKISILDEIAKKYHNILESFALPIKCSLQINDSFYGLTDRYIGEMIFTDYFNYLCEVSYYRVLSKIVIPKITDEKAITIIEDFVNFKNIEFASIEPCNPLYALYNKISFEAIKDLINQYIPLVSSVLTSYIDSSNPKDTIIEEFKKSLLYLHNKCLNIDKNKPSNISLTEELMNIII